ncbi:hypothetical protein QWY82_19155 [Simiduia curdlanivorans]|uniref:Outer membrane protein beta-barrel domain-containing protein n=1 Tax=Simiduia curdlanivorans TaxID=1492769 RepID=A0ABV8V2Y4_9GAMM|nr:hypothetical protein [Simiduia curdlanivorans]MDN3640925.1 hypothetical protein [Simiduia curdlanivorans]
MVKVSVVFSTALLCAGLCQAEPNERYLQGVVGWLQAEDVWQIDEDTSGEPLAADLGDLLYGGGAVQMNFGDAALEYGYETGGLVSFKNDTSYVAAAGNNGGAVAAKIDNEFWLVDLYMGAYTGIHLGDHLRFYASAGPALLIGSLDVDDSEPVPTPQSGTVVVSSAGRHTKGALGFYGKLGVDILFDSDITLGASLRQLNAKLDFGDAGEMQFNHPQYFITVGKKF